MRNCLGSFPPDLPWIGDAHFAYGFYIIGFLTCTISLSVLLGLWLMGADGEHGGGSEHLYCSGRDII